LKDKIIKSAQYLFLKNNLI